MTICNRCGSKAPDGALNCPQCGAPLVQRVENGFSPRQDQPEIPAWLESLRAGERPAPPTSDARNFSAADLLDEGALPGWMRTQRADGGSPSSTGPHDALRPASFSSPHTDGSEPAGFAARSLIDKNSLPSWMQEDKKPASDPGLPGDNNSAGAPFSAASLVDPDALPQWMQSQPTPQASGSAMPDWMQSLQPPSSAPRPSQPLPPPASSQPLEQNAMPDWMKSLQSMPAPSGDSAPVSEAPAPSGFSPRDLIDEGSVPSWMKQGSQGSPAPPVGAPEKSQPGMLSPGSLVDEGSVPSWMKQGNLAPASAAPNNVLSSQPGNALNSQPGMLSPGSLIDEGSLPGWMKQVQQPAAPPSSSLPPLSPFPGPPQNQQSWQPPQAPPPDFAPPPASSQNLSPGSLIDTGALPDWLKSAAGHYQEEQHAQRSQMPPPSAAQPHVESVRVPSRPRGEMNASESSEVAANVFASMLGVASSAPQFPGGPPINAPMQGGPPTAPSQPGYMAGPPSMVPPPAAPPTSMPGAPMPPQGYNIPGSYGGYQNMPPPSGMAPQPYGGGGQGGKKRSIVERLRDLFKFR